MVDRDERIHDELLVLECQAGKREAFEQLVSRWQGRLWQHAVRLTGREDIAMDVVQDSWLAIVKAIQRLDDPASFRRWAYTIVTRKASDWRRRRGREDPSLDANETHVEAAAPEAEVDGTVGLLREALRRLPGQPRALLTLRYLECFEIWELAAIFRIPVGTVRSRLHHARHHLREIIERIDG